MDTKYLIKVSDYQPELLPRPVPKNNLLEKSETLDELQIIVYGCELWSIVK